MFRIGEFSKLTRVSARMLRYYDKCGLLRPAEIDRFTGYRLYSAAQIPLLSRIILLRDMGFGVEEMEDILPRLDNARFMREILERKKIEIQSSIAAEQAKVERIDAVYSKLAALCGEGVTQYGKDNMLNSEFYKESVNMVYDVELKRLPAVKVLSLRAIIPQYRDEWTLWDKLGKYIHEQGVLREDKLAKATGYSVYYDDEHMEANPDVEVAIPVDSLGKSEGEFVYKEYEEIPLAAVVRFSGPFDGGYDAAGEKLAVWIEENGYAFAGYQRGHVLTSPDADKNPENWLTELQVPVKKIN